MKENNKKWTKRIGILLFLGLMGFVMVLSFDTEDMDELCNETNSTIMRINGTWQCVGFDNMTVTLINNTIYVNGSDISNYVPYQGANQTVNLSNQILIAGNETRIGTENTYIKVETLDMSGSYYGDLGTYIMLHGYSTGTFGDVITTPETMIMYDLNNDDLLNLNFVKQDVSKIGQIEYDTSTNTFEMKDALITDYPQNLIVTGNITTNEYFIGDGSLLTGIGGGNSSFNQTLTDNLYVPYQGATNNVNLSQYGITSNFLNTTNQTINMKRDKVFEKVIYYINATRVYTDITTEMGRSKGTATGDVLNVINDSIYFGNTEVFNNIYIDVATAKSATGILALQYSKGSGVWENITTITDGTTGLSTDGLINFTIPIDWATDSVNGSIDLYYFRILASSSTFSTEPTLYLAIPEDNRTPIDLYANINDIYGSIRVDVQGNIYLGETYAQVTTRGPLAMSGAFSGATTASFTGAISQSISSLTSTSRTTGLQLQSSTAPTNTTTISPSPTSLMTAYSWEAGSASQVTYIQNVSIASQEATPNKIWFSPDGINMYVMGSTGDDINWYILSEAWNINTAVNQSVYAVGNGETTPTGIYIKDDGLAYYVVGTTNDIVYQYTMSTAWNISTSTYDGISKAVGTEEATPNAVYFKNDGMKMYIMGSTGDDINQYNLTTAWNVSTATYEKLFSIAGQESGGTGLYISPDGYKAYVIGTSGDDVNEYRLGTAWDIGTAVYRIIYTGTASETNPTGIFWHPNGTSFYVLGSTLDLIRQFNVTVPWQIDTTAVATYATFYEYVMPTSGLPITATLNKGFRYGTSEYKDMWQYTSDGNFTAMGDICSTLSGKCLSNISSETGGNTSWNESYANTLYATNESALAYINSTGLLINWSEIISGTDNTTWNESYADTKYVPYTGAITDVDIGNHTITNGKIEINNNDTEIYTDTISIEEGEVIPLIIGVTNNSNYALGIPSLVTNYMVFYNEATGSQNIMTITEAGLLTLGGIDAVVGDVDNDTGIKEVGTFSGSLFGGENQSDKAGIVFKDGVKGGLGGRRRTGAISGIIEQYGDSWSGGLVFDVFEYTVNSSNASQEIYPALTTMYISGETQNVGIGTMTPNQKLEVNGSTNITGTLTAGMNTSIGTSTEYIRIEDMDLSGSAYGDLGHYPIIKGYSNGAFNNVFGVPESLIIYDENDDDYQSISFVKKDVSNIGQINYNSNTKTFELKNGIGTDTPQNLQTIGNITTTDTMHTKDLIATQEIEALAMQTETLTIGSLDPIIATEVGIDFAGTNIETTGILKTGNNYKTILGNELYTASAYFYNTINNATLYIGTETGYAIDAVGVIRTEGNIIIKENNKFCYDEDCTKWQCYNGTNMIINNGVGAITC